jgi:GT2 family glycosyltransferase
MPRPLLSIVVPTYNRPEMLGQCLDSIARSAARCAGADVEIIVTDDSPGTVSRDLVSTHYPTVRWVAGGRRGPARNRNGGVKASTGEWVLFTDDDCLVDEDWIGAFLTAMTEHSSASVLEGRTVADRERLRLDEESPVNLSGGYLWSCNMAIRRALFDRLGGFCESFPYAAMEDVDLRLRIQGLGESFPFVPAAIVCHPYRPSKGLGFVIKSQQSYLHLVERHPDMVARARWTTWLLDGARRCKALLLDAWACRCRGVPHAMGVVCVTTYYDFVARWRTPPRKSA